MGFGALFRGGTGVQQVGACTAAEKVATSFLNHLQAEAANASAKDSRLLPSDRLLRAARNLGDVAEGVRIARQLFDCDPKDDNEHFRQDVQKMMQKQMMQKQMMQKQQMLLAEQRRKDGKGAAQASRSSKAKQTMGPVVGAAAAANMLKASFASNSQTEAMVRSAKHRLDLCLRRLMLFAQPSFANFMALVRASSQAEWRAKPTRSLVDARLKAMPLPMRFVCVVESEPVHPGSVDKAFSEVMDVVLRMQKAGRARSPSLVRSRSNSISALGSSSKNRSKSPAARSMSPPPKHLGSSLKRSGDDDDELLAVDEIQQVLVLVAKCLKRKQNMYIKCLKLAKQQQALQQRQQAASAANAKVGAAKAGKGTGELLAPAGSPLARAAAALRHMLQLAERFAVMSAEACEQMPRICVRDLAGVLCPLIQFLASLTISHGLALATSHNPQTVPSTPDVTKKQKANAKKSKQTPPKTAPPSPAAIKAAKAANQATLRQLRRALFLVDPTFDNFTHWRKAHPAEYWTTKVGFFPLLAFALTLCPSLAHLAGAFIVDSIFFFYQSCCSRSQRKQSVCERVLRFNVSVGEKLEFFKRAGLFNEYNQVLRSLDRVVQRGAGGTLPKPVRVPHLLCLCLGECGM